jgi:hypothetical protein
MGDWWPFWRKKTYDERLLDLIDAAKRQREMAECSRRQSELMRAEAETMRRKLESMARQARLSDEKLVQGRR